MIMELHTKIGMKGILEIYEVDPKYDLSKMKDEEIMKVASLIYTGQNLITNIGYTTIANRLTGTGAYSATTYTYFAVSDGATAPALTRTAANFYADGTTWYTKLVATLETFSVGSLMQQWTCFLTSAENTVTSITKFALMNANPGTLMFNEILFAAISKSTTKQVYIKYKLYMTEI